MTTVVSKILLRAWLNKLLCAARPSKSDRSPNLQNVFILQDTTRGRAVGVYGRRWILRFPRDEARQGGAPRQVLEALCTLH
jgi:hypothetical protein